MPSTEFLNVDSIPFARSTLSKVILMRNISSKIVAFLKKEDGPTAVEYAVMLALIVVVCIAAITTLGTNANDTFSSVGAKAAPS
jgi:pilus assembly protein Flp/PilA